MARQAMTRDQYVAAVEARSLRIGGDLWTNDANYYRQAFQSYRGEVVVSVRPRGMLTGLWADVECTVERDGRRTVETRRVFG